VSGNNNNPIPALASRSDAWRSVVLPMALSLLSLAGCGTTQLSPPGRRLLEALQTAVSARNSQWLEAGATQVEAQHAKGELPDVDFRALQAIIAPAQKADWETAQSRALALSEAQRPSAEDLARAHQRQTAKP
jgi:hypothetical protein